MTLSKAIPSDVAVVLNRQFKPTATMPAELVCSALQISITQRNSPSGLIVHSDCGSQVNTPAINTSNCSLAPATS